MMKNWQHIINEDEAGKYLYKFLSKKYLLDFIKTGNIWFARADMFGDKLECITIPHLKNKQIKLEEVVELQQCHLISCFHQATYETIAFWDTFADNDETRRNFCIKFLKTDLDNYIINLEIDSSVLSNTKELYYGRVAYKNLLTNKPEKLIKNKVKKVSLRKEFAFAYEKEYRYIIRGNNVFKRNGFGLKIGKPSSLKYRILINPLLNDDKYSESIDLLEEHNVHDKFELTKITKFFKPHIYE